MDFNAGMTAFDPEVIRKVLDTLDEYNEDLRDRLANAPVFERATIFQLDFLLTRVKSADLISAWNAAQDTINILDSEAIEQGVMGQYVTLQGDGIVIPNYEVDLGRNVAIVSPHAEEDAQQKMFEQNLTPNMHTGKFQGFTLRFKKAEDNEGAYIPVLAYQVSAGSTYGTNIHVNLFASGDVGLTQLHFEKDDRRDGVEAVLNQLLESFADHADSINRINISLASSEKIDSSCLRHVGYHTEKLINTLEIDQRKRCEDLLADLIMLYIGRLDTKVISTRQFRMSGYEGDGIAFYHQEQPTILTQRCKNVVFLNRTVINNGTIKYLDRRMPHFAQEYEKSTVYVPLSEIEEFS